MNEAVRVSCSCFCLFTLDCLQTRVQGKPVQAAALFAALLALKHTFVFAAPALAVFIWKASPTVGTFILSTCVGVAGRFLPVGSVGLGTPCFAIMFVPCCDAVLAAAFIPFVYFGDRTPNEEVLKLFHRMFPFGRGLLHEYWAPNVWSLAATADKVLQRVLKHSTPPSPYDLATGNAQLLFG